MKQRVMYLVGPEQVELRQDPIPEPGAGEILMRLGAATTCGTDVKVFRRGGHPRMLRVPTPFGHEMAGSVAHTGAGVEWLKEGDRVVVSNSAPCGTCEFCDAGRENLCTDLHYLNGAFAEFLLVPPRFVERSIHRIPATLSFEEAALTEPLACVLHGIDACDLSQPSDIVLYGAGPIGLLFVGVLSAEGHRVVVCDLEPSRLEVAKQLGAVETVLFATEGERENATLPHPPGGKGFDVAIDATGVPRVWTEAIASVRPGGVVVLFGGCAPGTTIALDTHFLHYSEIMIKGVYHHRPATVARALDLLSQRAFEARLLLSAVMPLEALDEALTSMIRKETLKVVIQS